jgi:hypothetical protein
MSTIEDRLSAALAARADLVQPEDLRHGTPPAAVVVPLRRRPATYLLAAACAAAVSVPVLVTSLGDGEPAPPSTIPATPNGDEVAGAYWPVVYDYDGYDVDGDGQGDRLVIRTRSGEVLTTEPRRLEAHLSSGGTTAIVLDYGSYDLGATGPVDLDGDGADEIVYWRGTETEEMGVLRYADGALLDLEVPADPGLTSMNDEQGRLRARWIRDGQLFSSRSEEGGFEPGDGGKPLPQRYPVEVWTWTIDGQALAPVSQGQQCVEALEQTRPFPCNGDPGPLPGTQPAAEETAPVAQPFEADVDGDGQDDVISLEGPENKEYVEEGDVRLVVSLGSGGELTAPVPAGSSPDLFTTPYATDGNHGLLVRQEGGDSSTMTLYLLEGDELVVARPEGGIRLGNEFDGSGENTTRTSTWLTADGRLFSRRGPLSQEEANSWQFFEWKPDMTRIVAESYGFGCWEC